MLTSGKYLVRWEPQSGGFIADVPDFGRLYVRRLAKGSRYWIALHNGEAIKAQGTTHFGSAVVAKAAAENFYASIPS